MSEIKKIDMVYYGGSVKDPNYKLRFMLIVFCGMLSFGFALLWKSAMLLSAEYQDMGVTRKQIEVKKNNKLKQQSLKKEIKSIQQNN